MPHSLPTEPQRDSPSFRNGLFATDRRAFAIKQALKRALSQSQAVLEVLSQLEAVESDLFSALSDLSDQIYPSSAGQRDGGTEKGKNVDHGMLLQQVGAWRARGRAEEKDLIQSLLINNLQAARMDMKDRRIGVSNHSLIQTSEKDAEGYYTTLQKHLSSSYAPDLAKVEDARQFLKDSEYTLAAFDVHSSFLWSMPPTSLPLTDLAVCINLWLSSFLPQELGGSDSSLGNRILEARSPSIAQSGTLEAQEEIPVKRHRRVISHSKSHGALPSKEPFPRVVPVTTINELRRQVQDELQDLAKGKENLEAAWARRDYTRTRLEREIVERNASLLELERQAPPRASVSLERSSPRISQSPRLQDEGSKTEEMALPVSSSGIGYTKIKEKRHGMDRIRGFMSSTSISAGLARITNAPMSSPETEETESPPNRRSFQLPSTRSEKQIKRSSLQEIPASPSVPISKDSPSSVKFPRQLSVTMEEISAGGLSALAIGNDDGDSRGEKSSEGQAEEHGRREGYLWTTSMWEGLAGHDRKDRSRWDRLWVVLGQNKIVENRCDGMGVQETVDLRLATVRIARDVERRFTFEIVTPAKGRRLYQARSETDMQTWTTAITRSIEDGYLDGLDGVRPSDTTSKPSESSRAIRRTSMKHLGHAIRNRSSLGFGGQRPNSDSQGRSASPSSRHSSLSVPPRPSRHSSFSSDDGQVGSRPVPIMPRQNSGYAIDLDDETRAILQQYNAPTVLVTPDMEKTTPLGTRRPSPVGRSMSADGAILDMSALRRCLQIPGNRTCADCGEAFAAGGIWATIGLHGKPAVAFVCIACSGAHRNMGSHISKVRSVDLDRWSEDSILHARAWGNARVNAIFEKQRPEGLCFPAHDPLKIQDWIRSKYERGAWLGEEDRQYWLGEQSSSSDAHDLTTGVAL